MNYVMLTFGNMNNSIILFVFAIIVLILGIYVMYMVHDMKKTQSPPAFVIPEQERAKIKKPEEFCKEIRPSLIGIGVVCIIYGIYEMFEFLFIGLYMAKVVGAVGLLVLIIVFFSSLSKSRTKFTK